jgi:Flp pilus assembly protein protease CpaA
MKIINIINAISIHLLVAILLQYFIVGMFTYSMKDFFSFAIHNWILEVLYLTFVITLALKK